MLSSNIIMQPRSSTMIYNAQSSANDATGRRVLGDMSPNIRKVAPSGHLNTNSDNKPVASSPLKRSFTASMESTAGFKYLKRRKVSFENHMERSNHGSKPVHEIFPLPQNLASVQLSPTEINTPSCSEEDDANEPGAMRQHPALQSFSSLVNFDGPSSQGSTSSQQDVPRRLFRGPSMAELLKLRLKVAMYKVRTNQVNVPFDELLVDDETECLEETTRSPTPEMDESIEDMVARRRREAQSLSLLTSTQQSIPKLTSAPLLLPTAFSSRMIYADYEPPSLSSQLPSSTERTMGASAASALAAAALAAD